MNFGPLFKKLRKEVLGLSQVELSQKLGVSQSLLSKIEAGKLDPPLRVFIRMRKLLGVRLRRQLDEVLEQEV